jgi:hypothetical protein
LAWREQVNDLADLLAQLAQPYEQVNKPLKNKLFYVCFVFSCSTYRCKGSGKVKGAQRRDPTTRFPISTAQRP